MSDLRSRLMSKVVVDPISGCWVWTGSCSGPGSYGQINVGGRMKYVHRVSYELEIGPIPPGHEIDHVKSRGCTHTRCIWPDHLEPVLHLENFHRSSAAGSYTSRTGVCRDGHKQTQENVYVNPRTGERQCRPCKTARTIESNERRRAQRG